MMVTSENRGRRPGGRAPQSYWIQLHHWIRSVPTGHVPPDDLKQLNKATVPIGQRWDQGFCGAFFAHFFS